jgi:hypothetical protein
MVRGVEQNRTPFSSPIRPVAAVRNVRQSASISQDTVSRHPLASDAPPPRDVRSPLKIVIDCFFCIKSIILLQLRKILSLFFKTSPASTEDQQQDPQPLLTEPSESFEEDDFSPPLLHTLGARLHKISE